MAFLRKSFDVFLTVMFTLFAMILARGFVAALQQSFPSARPVFADIVLLVAAAGFVFAGWQFWVHFKAAYNGKPLKKPA